MPFYLRIFYRSSWHSLIAIPEISRKKHTDKNFKKMLYLMEMIVKNSEFDRLFNYIYLNLLHLLYKCHREFSLSRPSGDV